MQRFIHILLLAALPGFFSFAQPLADIEWSSDIYENVHADFDGDGQLDTLLLAKSADYPSIFSSDVMDSSTTTEHWFSYDPTVEYVVSGDFDNDGQDELLVLDNTLAGSYYELNNNGEFVAGNQRLQITGYNKNRQINFTHLVKGDFNGDTSDDLMAYAEASNDVVILFNKQAAKKIQFKFDAQLSLNSNAPLTPMVTDFNGDGKEDIALLPSVSGGEAWIALAGEDGRFKQSDFEDITPFLDGEDLSTGQHTIHTWSDENTEERHVLRLSNAPGGVDEEGNNYSNDEAVLNTPELTKKAVNQSSAQSVNDNCQHLAYSVLHKRTSRTCGFYADDAATATSTPGLISTAAPQTLQNKNGGVVSAASAPARPSWASAVVRNGDDITISWASVSGTTYYNRQVSLNGGGWQNTKTYNAPQTSVIFYDQKARSYRYRIRACNSSGCSSWRETGTVTVAAAAPVPSTPGSAPGVSGGSYHPVNAFFSVSVSSVTHATRYEIFVGTSSSNVSANKSGSGTSYSIWSGGSYGYRYIKYRACNATGCSGLSPWKRVYIYTTPGTPGSFSTSSSTISPGGSVTLSWTSAGGIVPAGYYALYETKPGASEVQIASTTAGSGSSYSRTVTPSAGTGSYTYRIRACNPSGAGCGGSRTVTVNVMGTAATPAISPTGRVFDNSLSISMSTSTSGATIYYTTNGSTPTSSSTRYSGAFNISANATIRAIAVKSGWHNSGVRTEVFDRNYPPSANNDNLTLDEDTSKSLAVLNNDSDPDNDSLSLYTVGQAANGATSKNGSLAVYTPNANYCGTDSFTYTVSDGRVTSNATVTVTVNCLPEPVQKRIVYVHTDALGSPAAETDENGDLQ